MSTKVSVANGNTICTVIMVGACLTAYYVPSTALTAIYNFLAQSSQEFYEGEIILLMRRRRTRENITAEGCLHLGSHSWTTGWHSKGQQPTCWDDRRWKRAQVLAESWNYWVNSGTTYLWILCSINHQCHDDHYVGQHSIQQWPAILMEIYIPMPSERNQSGWKATHLAGDHFASWWGGFSYGWSQPRGNGQFFAIYGYHFYYCFIKIISLFFA